MNKIQLAKIFACPRCHSALSIRQSSASCLKCSYKATKSGGIWALLNTREKTHRHSKQGYEDLHQLKSGGPTDGSYEILAAMAQGNKTLDIACGEGIIEQMSPETVGLDFSMNALKKARLNKVKYLIQAKAESLPFKDNSFDVAICAGSLEHFNDPQKAINEMVRVSKIQLLTVHREFNLPFIRFGRKLVSQILNIYHQPIESPLTWKELEKMLNRAGTHIVFQGLWTLPVNYGRVIEPLPVFKNIPSCFFVMTAKL